MPIRAGNKQRYPQDWKRIRAAILERAKDRCEFCGAPNHALGHWGDDQFVRVPKRIAQTPGICYIRGICRKVIRIVLTVAHLDHTPENCDPENLRALCQRCHNRYDAKTRAVGIRRRRMEARKTEMLEI